MLVLQIYDNIFTLASKLVINFKNIELFFLNNYIATICLMFGMVSFCVVYILVKIKGKRFNLIENNCDL